MKKWIKRIVFVVIAVGVLLVGISFFVKWNGDASIIAAEDTQGKAPQAVIVLGAGVKNGVMGLILKDRMSTGLELLERYPDAKLLCSGDHGREGYDEVGTMMVFAVDNGVEEERIFLDHAGFSTYETMKRAKEIFGIERAIIVTQEFHLSRAVYIANHVGIEAYGVKADKHEYPDMLKYNVREMLARAKDFFSCLFQVPPTYLGESIPISGSGVVTHD
ncbi:YdcF family protein [Clostridia bacterium OttesenSCG-928-F22]|nr:YdcF family protein [Clostridia bacterium OttesenSCG-928-F22]